MAELCTDGIFRCAFGLTFGVVLGIGGALLVLLLIAAYLGFFDR